MSLSAPRSNVRIVTGLPSICSIADARDRLELLVLVGQPGAIQEQELGAEQADAGRAVLDAPPDLVGPLDVRVQLDAHAVERLRRQVAQALELLPLEQRLALLQRYSASTARSGLTMTTLAVAVDDQDSPSRISSARCAWRRPRRNLEAARDDRGVRRHAAEVGEEPGERCTCSWITSAGDRSYATRIASGRRPAAARVAAEHAQPLEDELDDRCARSRR